MTDGDGPGPELRRRMCGTATVSTRSSTVDGRVGGVPIGESPSRPVVCISGLRRVSDPDTVKVTLMCGLGRTG